SRGGYVYQLQADYDQALERWPSFQRYDPFQRPAAEPPPDWVRACTALVRAAGDPLSVHAEQGAGPLLAKLRTLPAVDSGPWTAPRFARGEPLPAEVFGPKSTTVGALQQMRETEKGSGTNPQLASADTPATRVQAFAVFVSSAAHMLGAVPQEAVTMARNH